MEISYDGILNSTKEYLEKYGEKDVEEKVNKVGEIEQHLQAINQVMLDPEHRAEDQSQGLQAVQDACKSVAYGDYLPTQVDAAALTKLVNEMRIENLPASIRPKGIEIKGYVDDIKAQLLRIKNVVNELAKKLKECGEKGYKISDVEKKDMKMTTLEVESDLEICKNYQTRAEEALKEIESETASYQQRQKKAAWIKVGCATIVGLGAGAITAGATAVAFAAGAIVTALGVSAAGAGGGAILGGATGGYQAYSIYPLLVGAAVSVPFVCLVLKRWFAERQICIELLSIHRNYRDLVSESQSIRHSFNNDLRTVKPSPNNGAN